MEQILQQKNSGQHIPLGFVKEHKEARKSYLSFDLSNRKD